MVNDGLVVFLKSIIHYVIEMGRKRERFSMSYKKFQIHHSWSYIMFSPEKMFIVAAI